MQTQKNLEKTCLNCSPEIWNDPQFKAECDACTSTCKRRILANIALKHIRARVSLQHIQARLLQSSTLDRTEQRLAALRGVKDVNLWR